MNTDKKLMLSSDIKSKGGKKMSSFTHFLEKEILEHHIRNETLYMGLSRQDGNRQGDFADWVEDGEGGWEVEDDGIDEVGEGKVYDEETETWVDESTPSYSRVAVTSTDWHEVEVVLGEEGDSEVRISTDIDFGALTEEDEDWGTVSHFFLADSDTEGAGNILAYGTMPDSVHLVEGMEAKIWGNTIVIRMTD